MIWIIGAGTIAQEYAKVLNALNKQYQIIGRGEEKARQVEEALGCKVITGGLDSFLTSNPELPEAAIVATNLGSLAPNTMALVKYGVKRILCEKPGFLFPEECEKVAKVAKDNNAEVFQAYNRRFFASVMEAERIIAEDGGLKSFNFEFTEWGHVIAKYNKPQDELKNWFYANSTHVVDLAFFLGGTPVEMINYSKDEADWHKPINFAGAGRTDKDVLFNYQANWDAPGRWAVELLTSQHRIYLKPMEQLQLQDKGSVKIYPVEIDDHLDKEFKPGFYLETKAFLEGDTERLCSIGQQCTHVINIYNKILGK
jgi:predicted dehydrogenase